MDSWFLDYPRSVPEDFQGEPIRAWRYVRLSLTEDGWTMGSLFWEEHPLGIVNQAKCGHHEQVSPWVELAEGDAEHGACPSTNCSCGLYALKSPHHVDEVGPYEDIYTLAEVDLYGRVIEHELGYRAQFQRIMAIYFNPLCSFCNHQGEQTTAIGILMLAQFPKPVCVDHVYFYEALGIGSAGVSTPSEIASEIGVEARWRTL